MAATKKSLLLALGLGENGYLIGSGSDAKTVKGEKIGITTGVMYLMPTDALCPVSLLAACREACLVSAGRAAFTPGIGMARAARTRAFQENREKFLELLIRFEIPRIIRKAKKAGTIPAIRLNGTSDINWSTVRWNGKTVFEHFPDTQFYDYTKSPSIVRAAAGVPNWHVTASYSGANQKYVSMITAAAAKYGSNLAVVFRKDKPEYYMGMRVIDGDANDVRFFDEKNVVVGLKAKGKAKRDQSGFVVDCDNVIAVG